MRSWRVRVRARTAARLASSSSAVLACAGPGPHTPGAAGSRDDARTRRFGEEHGPSAREHRAFGRARESTRLLPRGGNGPGRHTGKCVGRARRRRAGGRRVSGAQGASEAGGVRRMPDRFAPIPRRESLRRSHRGRQHFPPPRALLPGGRRRGESGGVGGGRQDVPHPPVPVFGSVRLQPRRISVEPERPAPPDGSEPKRNRGADPRAQGKASVARDAFRFRHARTRCEKDVGREQPRVPACPRQRDLRRRRQAARRQIRHRERLAARKGGASRSGDKADRRREAASRRRKDASGRRDAASGRRNDAGGRRDAASLRRTDAGGRRTDARRRRREKARRRRQSEDPGQARPGGNMVCRIQARVDSQQGQRQSRPRAHTRASGPRHAS